MRTLASLVLLVLWGHARAGGPFDGKPALVATDYGPAIDTDTLHHENTRLIGSVLAVLAGPFGAHRLYLGTTPKVAIIYGLTFGGFGILALLDLGHLLFSKDLESYRNSDRVFMWSKPEAAPTPP
ncbi:MAG TPA: TM2 domain-containing protein [Flavobacteriales bacterium]|nr:TM2 domain-containing protein [Flavobacteriales bacterium]